MCVLCDIDNDMISSIFSDVLITNQGCLSRIFLLSNLLWMHLNPQYISVGGSLVFSYIVFKDTDISFLRNWQMKVK